MAALFLLPLILAGLKALAPLAIRTIGGALIGTAVARITGSGGRVQGGPVIDTLADEEEEFLEEDEFEEEEEEEVEEEEAAPISLGGITGAIAVPALAPRIAPHPRFLEAIGPGSFGPGGIIE